MARRYRRRGGKAFAERFVRLAATIDSGSPDKVFLDSTEDLPSRRALTLLPTPARDPDLQRIDTVERVYLHQRAGRLEANVNSV